MINEVRYQSKRVHFHKQYLSIKKVIRKCKRKHTHPHTKKKS